MDEEKKNEHDLQSSDGLANFFSDIDDDDLIDGEYDDIDQLIDEIMALLENYGPITGGLITFTTIYEYLQQGNHPNLTQDTCFDVIARMRSNHIFNDELTYPEYPDLYIYVFQDVQLTEEMKHLIKFFVESNSQDRATLKEKTQWDAILIEGTINHLIEKAILKFENGKYLIPALSP
jgi:hypothetical protein